MAGAIGLAVSVGMGAAVKLGGKVLGKVLGRAAEAAESEVAGAADEAESSLASDAEHAGECGCSFSADTPVATPTGERAIGSLQVGDHVTAYDPTTGKTSTQTVQHVWINHDDDLIDLTLRVADQQQANVAQNKQQEVALRAHGLRAPPADDVELVGTGATTSNSHDEVIHTTSRHPWLTTKHGFVAAGGLHVGEGIVREGAPAATIVGMRIVPGAGTMYNLTVSVLHTYAVGTSHFVVHNTGAACKLGGGDGATKDSVDLYRAVGKREFKSIMDNNAFLPGGNSLEGRQFALTLDDALAYARTDVSKVAIIKATIKKSALAGLDFSRNIDVTIFKEGVVTVQPWQSEFFHTSLLSIEHVL